MLIKRTSILTNITREIDLPITQEELDHYVNSGILIQNAFPNLTAFQREFIMTGITEDEWKQHVEIDSEEDMGDDNP